MAILLYKWLLMYIGLLPADRHPLYISVTEMNYNQVDKNLEISCRMFTDDFEKTLASVNHTKVDLTHPPDKAAADKMIAAYVKSHLQLKLNNRPVILEFIGYEKENDAIWSYFEISHTAAAPKKIDVVNSILYESYDKQINLMHVSVAGSRKSTRLDYPDKEASFSF